MGYAFYPGGQCRQGKATAHCGDFLMPAAPSHYDRPGKFLIFQENSQFKLYLQGFRYTNDMEKLAEGRIVANYTLLVLSFSKEIFGEICAMVRSQAG